MRPDALRTGPSLLQRELRHLHPSRRRVHHDRLRGLDCGNRLGPQSSRIEQTARLGDRLLGVHVFEHDRADHSVAVDEDVRREVEDRVRRPVSRSSGSLKTRNVAPFAAA